jgi:ATP-dependent Clp protease ATP-binding subunit ClpA
MTLELGDSLIQKARDEGSAQASTTFGARPMRRAAQRFLEDAVSDAIVRGFVEEGDSATVDLAPAPRVGAVDRTCFVVQVSTRGRAGEPLWR